MGCKAQTAALAVARARICNVADRPRPFAEARRRDGVLQRFHKFDMLLVINVGYKKFGTYTKKIMINRQEHKKIVAIVTGAASGIGCAVTKSLLEKGINVVAIDIHWKENNKHSHECVTTITADVSSESDCLIVFKKISHH